MTNPALFAGCWFMVWRFAWALYWFTRPQMATFAFKAQGGFLPIGLSAIAAFAVGWRYGRIILDPERTRSLAKAVLWGILFEHLTTLIYLPIASLVLSLQLGSLADFPARLLLSLIASLAGISIHTLLGGITGTLLFAYASHRKAKA